MQYFIGVDVGASEAKFLAICLDTLQSSGPLASVVKWWEGEETYQLSKHKTPKNPQETTELILQLLPQFYSACGITSEMVNGICVDLPMAVDLEGIPAVPPNLCSSWQSFDLRSKITEATDKETQVINDGTAVALGECARLWPNAQERAGKSILILSGGTGLACGFVANGNAYLGADGFAGEGGHTLFDPRAVGINYKIRCGCGSDSCIEPYVSLSGLKFVTEVWQRRRDEGLASRCARRTLEALGVRSDLTRSIPDLPKDHPLEKLDDARWAFNMLRIADQQQDITCRSIFARQAQCLGAAFGGMINLLNPDALVIGGGIAETSPDFQKFYLNHFRQGMNRTSMPFIARRYDIESGRIIFSDGDYAALGAALYAYERSAS